MLAAPLNMPAKILIADAYDERDMYAEYLRAHGFDVRVVRTAREALAAVRAHKPHAVVVGAVLPDAAGETVIAKIKSSPARRSVPVLMLTGFLDRDHLTRFHASGADAILLKPCLPDELLRHVRRLIPGGPAEPTPDS